MKLSVVGWEHRTPKGQVMPMSTRMDRGIYKRWKDLKHFRAGQGLPFSVWFHQQCVYHPDRKPL